MAPSRRRVRERRLGLVIWIFGEAFGQLFAPGASFLFGAPGAALFYAFAGSVLALSAGFWEHATSPRRALRLIGLFLLGMALLQGWPGRGFWHPPGGEVRAGTLVSMVRTMAALALATGSTDAVLTTAGDYTRWRPLATGAALTAGAAAHCRPVSLSAVAYAIDDEVLVGARCRGIASPLFAAPRSGSWRAVALEGAAQGVAATVRLDAAGGLVA